MGSFRTAARLTLCAAWMSACDGSVQVSTGGPGSGATGGLGGTGGAATSGGGGSGGTTESGGSAAGGGETGGEGGTGTTSTAAPFCGDGEVDPGEACDDGNADDGDACSATCLVELMTLTPPNGIAEWPDVTATNHDGGQGFLVVWRSTSPQTSVMAAAVTAKGAVSEAAKVFGGNLPPGAAPLPDGRVFVGARSPNASLFAGTLDATTLAQVDELPVTFGSPVATFGLELAVKDFGAMDLGEVATIHRKPKDPMGDYLHHACVLYPYSECVIIGPTPVGADGAIAADVDHFLAAIPMNQALGYLLLDGASLIAGNLLDEPSNPSTPHLAARPGGWVVTWQTITNECVYYRLLDQSLAPVGAAQQIEGSCEEQAWRPRVAVGPTGRFVVTFWDLLADPAPFSCRVRAAAFEADGTPSGPTFDLSEGTDCASEVRAAANLAGDVLFVWNRDDFATDWIEAKLVPKLLE